MKCFNHRELDAIAVCKHCGKALCSQCLPEIREIAACKGRCEAAVSIAMSDEELRRRNLDMQTRIWNGLSRFNYALGFVMGGFGAYDFVVSLGPRSGALMLIALGFALCLSAYGFQRYAQELKRRITPTP